jgi:hypothetical protein
MASEEPLHEDFAAHRVFIGILPAAVLIGIALVGLAAGQSLRVGRLLAMRQHPFFGTGTRCLVSSAVCAVLLAVNDSNHGSKPP